MATVGIDLRQPSVEELEDLVDEWLASAVRSLWRGDIDAGAAFFLAAAELVMKLDLAAIELGQKFGTWDFGQFVEWVDDAKAQASRRWWRGVAC